MTLSDLERRDATGQIFQADLLNKSRTVWRRTNKFGRVTREEGHRGSATHLPQGAGPNPPQLLGFPYIYAYTIWCRITKFDVVTHGAGACFYGSVTPPSQGQGPSTIILGFPIYAYTRCCRTTNFDVVTWWRDVYHGVSHAPFPRELVSVLPIMGFCFIYAYTL